MSEPTRPKINEGQPLSIVLDGKETLLYPGDEWVYISEGGSDE